MPRSLIPLARWAEMHGITPSRARQMALAGELPATKPGRDWMIPEDVPKPPGRKRGRKARTEAGA